MDDKVLAEHMKEDAAFQNEQRKINNQMLEKLDGLATSQDIADLKKFMGQVNVGIGIFRFSWNNAGKLGAFAMLLLGIYILFKVGFLGALMWLAKIQP